MKNIYDKLHKASEDAAPVIKGDKVPGMHFKPLQHDEVQKVAMDALRKNKLYPLCNYENEIKDSFIFITCNMTIYDVDEPSHTIEIKGCSAMGKLDKFGTGNAMSYARKYAFLNALNLKTGMDNDDGVEPAPFARPKPRLVSTSDQTKTVKEMANDWIKQMESVASHSKSALYFEKNLTPIRTEFKSDLMSIATDAIEQMRVDAAYNKLKSQIQNRSPNGR